ncbi:MAG: Gfo/Idh/MocA family oxidoreductase [Planctomycetota bacterium]
MTVRVALLGNSFASLVQLPALRWAAANGAPNQVVGIAGADAEKARATAREWSIPRATDRWEDLFDDAPDLAIVTTPVDLHAPMVRAALAAGAAVLCEKPFTLDASEARALAEEARGRLSVIDHQSRWSPWRRELAKRVASGMAGAPWSSRVLVRWGAPKRLGMPFTWWYDAARGGGALGALGSHMVDGVLDQFGTRFEAVTARLATYVREREGAGGAPVDVTADEAAWILAELEGGTPCELHLDGMAFAGTRDAGGGNLIEWTGSEGTLRLEGDVELVWTPHGGDAEILPVEPLPTNAEMGMPDVGIFARCLPGYLRDVVRAVAEGASELPGAATFDDAVHVMDVLDASRRSAAEGRRIPIGEAVGGAA